MILTFISVANAYIRRYPHHPQQASGPVVMRGSWVGIYAKNKVPESLTLAYSRTRNALMVTNTRFFLG